jgi:hypothetical protein
MRTLQVLVFTMIMKYFLETLSLTLTFSRFEPVACLPAVRTHHVLRPQTKEQRHRLFHNCSIELLYISRVQEGFNGKVVFCGTQAAQ